MTRVAIIEDHEKIRNGLAALIHDTAGYRCTGSFASAEEALDGIGCDLPDVALVDLGLPGMSGVDGIRLLKERHPGIQFLVLSIYADDRRIFEALCAGACGYLLKKTAPVRLLECIQEAKTGGAPMSPEVAKRVIELFRRFRPPEPLACDLSAQETRVLQLLAEGHSYNAAGAQLGISVNTVRFYIRAIYEKLQVHSKSEAVSKAVRQGIIR